MSEVTIGQLFTAGTLRLLMYFLLHPEDKLHFRALKERLGMGTGALQRELARLETLGLVFRLEEMGKVYYLPNLHHPSWTAFRILLREHADPMDVLRDALRDVPGIRLAFVYGSTVRGNARPDSDIDIFIVEEGMPLEQIGLAATEVESLLDRRLDLRCYTPALLTERMERGSGFLRDALSGPKAWLIGSENLLPTV